MRITLVFALVIVVIAAVFALQNSQMVRVGFLFWTFEGPLVLVVLVTFAAGTLAGWLTAIPSAWRRTRELQQLRKDLRQPPPDAPSGQP